MDTRTMAWRWLTLLTAMFFISACNSDVVGGGTGGDGRPGKGGKADHAGDGGWPSDAGYDSDAGPPDDPDAGYDPDAGPQRPDGGSGCDADRLNVCLYVSGSPVATPDYFCPAGYLTQYVHNIPHADSGCRRDFARVNCVRFCSEPTVTACGYCPEGYHKTEDWGTCWWGEDVTMSFCERNVPAGFWSCQGCPDGFVVTETREQSSCGYPNPWEARCELPDPNGFWTCQYYACPAGFRAAETRQDPACRWYEGYVDENYLATRCVPSS